MPVIRDESPVVDGDPRVVCVRNTQPHAGNSTACVCISVCQAKERRRRKKSLSLVAPVDAVDVLCVVSQCSNSIGICSPLPRVCLLRSSSAPGVRLVCCVCAVLLPPPPLLRVTVSLSSVSVSRAHIRCSRRDLISFFLPLLRSPVPSQSLLPRSVHFGCRARTGRQREDGLLFNEGENEQE